YGGEVTPNGVSGGGGGSGGVYQVRRARTASERSDATSTRSASDGTDGVTSKDGGRLDGQVRRTGQINLRLSLHKAIFYQQSQGKGSYQGKSISHLFERVGGGDGWLETAAAVVVVKEMLNS
ncbi:hypothetical protein ElyMa_002287600, partial [Elysia marginata]